MRVLVLSNNPQTSAALAQGLSAREAFVALWDKPLTPEALAETGADFAVSYNYSHIIRAAALAALPGGIINLHVSLLPWNRGASPNLWSWIDDTPKGVTIHQVDEGLDTGDILASREVPFPNADGRETLATTYEALHAAIQALFFDCWPSIKAGKPTSRKQTGRGTAHTLRQTRAVMAAHGITWGTKVSTLKRLPRPPPRKAFICRNCPRSRKGVPPWR